MHACEAFPSFATGKSESVTSIHVGHSCSRIVIPHAFHIRTRNVRRPCRTWAAQKSVREAERTTVTAPSFQASDNLGKVTTNPGGLQPPDPEDDPNAPRFEDWPAQRSFSEVLMDKTNDTIGDLLLIARRTLRELPRRSRIRAQLRRMRNKGAGNDDAPISLKSDKPIILVLGSGWGAHSLIKVINTDKFEVMCVSPRNHFIFTPMLPSSAVGTVEFRSLLEPIRISNPFVTYIEAECEVLDVKRKLALCGSTFAYENGRRPQFEVAYDAVVIAVGEQTATFGVPGVMEHCYFLKEISDAVGLRRRIGQCFELAALPGTLEEDRKRALRFIVVGGGPTGVEFAGTLRDFVRGDLARKYPELMGDVEVVLLQSAQSILTQFSAGLQQRALDTFRKTGVSVRTGVRVIAITQDQVVLEGGERLDYGVCVWSTGNAARPLVQAVAGALPEQREALQGRNPASAKLAVDPFLRVAGARDAIALGDCSRLSGAPLPATAQVAGQQGAYVARMINKGYRLGTGGLDKPFPARWKEDANNQDVEYFDKPFAFLSLGLMAYVGSDQAITQLEAGKASFSLAGYLSFLLWRSVYITKQLLGKAAFLPFSSAKLNHRGRCQREMIICRGVTGHLPFTRRKALINISTLGCSFITAGGWAHASDVDTAEKTAADLLIADLLAKSKANKAKYDKERLDSYYRRNLMDYFKAGSDRGLSKELQAEILEWIRKNENR